MSKLGIQMATTDRHQLVQDICLWLDYTHMPAARQHVGLSVCELMLQMLEDLQDGPELLAGLRHLLEAKDCFVRQMIADEQTDNIPGGGELEGASDEHTNRESEKFQYEPGWE